MGKTFENHKLDAMCVDDVALTSLSDVALLFQLKSLLATPIDTINNVR
jgi:hypothetical protein